MELLTQPLNASAVIKVTLLWVWVTQQHASSLMGAELMGVEQCHLERELTHSNLFNSSKALCLKWFIYSFTCWVLSFPMPGLFCLCQEVNSQLMT